MYLSDSSACRRTSSLRADPSTETSSLLIISFLGNCCTSGNDFFRCNDTFIGTLYKKDQLIVVGDINREFIYYLTILIFVSIKYFKHFPITILNRNFYNQSNLCNNSFVIQTLNLHLNRWWLNPTFWCSTCQQCWWEHQILLFLVFLIPLHPFKFFFFEFFFEF